jgi:hypothetical protein
MDEKGFMAGVIGKQKRVFSKALYKREHAQQSSHDGNREWITVIACVCGNGTALLPGLIFQADSANVQSNWVSDIDKKKHSVYTTVSPSGWSNNDAGLGWVEQVFNPLTKDKARRKWRLLIMDGHGSHITMDFLSYCAEERILVLIYPPHSTHTLQPLDVVCFSPLATNYTTALAIHLHSSQGLTPFQKGDFFKILWEAWTQTFTGKLILRSFEAVGIAPLNPNVILNCFTPSQAEAAAAWAFNEADNWRHNNKVWRQPVKDPAADEAKELRQTLPQLTNQNELLKMERDGFREALSHTKTKLCRASLCRSFSAKRLVQRLNGTLPGVLMMLSTFRISLNNRRGMRTSANTLSVSFASLISSLDRSLTLRRKRQLQRGERKLLSGSV